MAKFLTSSRKIKNNANQDDLLQAGEVFLLSNDKSTSSKQTLTRFQQEAKEQLVLSLEEVLVSSVLHPFTKRIRRHFPNNAHGGISKHAHITFQYLQILENEILANSAIQFLCKNMSGFRAQWATLSDTQIKLLGGLGTVFPRPDALQYFNIEASKAYNAPLPEFTLESSESEIDNESSKDSKQQENKSTISVPKSSILITTPPRKPPPAVPKRFNLNSPKLSESEANQENPMTQSKGRLREKRKSISTFSSKKFRTFLKKKPSIVDDLLKDNEEYHLDNAKKLNLLSRMSDTSTDVHEIELDTRYSLKESTNMKIIPTIDDLPGLMQSFHSSVFIMAELGSKLFYFL